MSTKVVRRFDVHVEEADALGDVAAWLRTLVDHESGDARPLEIKQDHRASVLEVRLETGASTVARVMASVARRGLRVHGNVLRMPPDRPSPHIYPDPRVLLSRGLEPGARVASIPCNPRPVTVAIVDSGIMDHHPSLKGHLWTGRVGTTPEAHGARCIDKPEEPDVSDQDGHGTRLAGTILAGAEGAPGVQLMAVKFFDAITLPAARNAAAAINFALKNQADIINLSWDLGIGAPELDQAIQEAYDRNVLVVIAAGNAGTDNDDFPPIPARYAKGREDRIITVMATNRYDEKASFSNYGRKTVDLAAPGVGIVTTRASVAGASGNGARRFRSYTGTSASAAYVSGAAALLKLLHPEWKAKELKLCLVRSVEHLPGLKCETGGRLDLAQAIRWRGP
jgi:hypothetical protein